MQAMCERKGHCKYEHARAVESICILRAQFLQRAGAIAIVTAERGDRL